VPSPRLTMQIASVVSTLIAVGILDTCEVDHFLCMILVVCVRVRLVVHWGLGWGQAVGFA
jgi:hypothetical protein